MTAADRIPELYNRHALAFDRARGRSLFERAWLDRFLALVPAGGHVLDMGCGSGDPIARYLIESGRRVTGVDTSPRLLQLAGSRFPAATWIAADMRTFASPQSFDGVIAWDSFFHLTGSDQTAMFPVFQRLARAGAPLMFTSGPRRGEAIGTFEGEPLYHASLDPDTYRHLLAEASFSVLAHQVEDPARGGHTVWLAQRAP